MQLVGTKDMPALGVEVGRRFYYHAGYGEASDEGTIVEVQSPSEDREPLPTWLRATVLVVLDDGRSYSVETRTFEQKVGVRHELLNDVIGPDGVAEKRDLARRYAEEQERRKQAKTRDFIARSARPIEGEPVVFYWNGIKDQKQKGVSLQKASYSYASREGYPPGTIIVYAREYSGFSSKVGAQFEIENDTDSQVDYFDKDRFLVVPEHPLYPCVLKALEAQQLHNERRYSKRQ